MEAGEYGRTRGTCFVARRLESVAVAGLLWLSWRVLGGVDFFVSFLSFFSLQTHIRPAASTSQPFLMYLSSSTGFVQRAVI